MIDVDPDQEDTRFSSRKWKLVNRTVERYTYVHLLNAAGILLCLSRGWLPGELIKDLWITSLTIWSVGTLTIVGWYMKKNVDQNIANGKRP